jgi:hypothetical protein
MARLSRGDEPVAGFVEDAIVGGDDGLPQASRKAWHQLAARIAGTRSPHDGARFADLIRRARAERTLREDSRRRYVVLDGSALVELLAGHPPASGPAEDRELYQKLLYAEVERRIPVRQWARIGREDSEIWLLNALSLARLRAPDVLVVVSPDPQERRVAELLRRTRRTSVLEVDAGHDAAGIADLVAATAQKVAPPAPAAS